MKRILIAVMLIITGIALGVFVSANLFKQTIVQAQPAKVKKWEYCTVSRAKYSGNTKIGVYWISYFKEDGVQVVEIEETATERNGATKAIAKLGAEGWELVGTGNLDIRQGAPVDALYFKRQK